MIPYLQTPDTTLYQGDSLSALQAMPTASVHAIVTSPPYFGQRDYGTGQWAGGDPACKHQLRSAATVAKGAASSTLDSTGRTHTGHQLAGYRRVCGRCGAERVDDHQVGLEETPAAYVERMVILFREARRVLRPDGQLWLNLGDSYSGSGPISQPQTAADVRHALPHMQKNLHQRRVGSVAGLGPKQLLGIPWRVAFALQADGWTLRSDIIWHKPNAMPGSQKDRPTTAHEYLFLLTPRPRYYFDHIAIQEPASQTSGWAKQRAKGVNTWQYNTTAARTAAIAGGRHGRDSGFLIDGAKRNRRSVWSINTRPFKGAHFAVFPPALVEPCVLAGTSEHGVCAKCGAPYRRQVKKVTTPVSASPTEYAAGSEAVGIRHGKGKTNLRQLVTWETTGWLPTCRCASREAPAPAVVLDPFCGSGTTGKVAHQHGRHFVGIDLNAEYLEIAIENLGIERESLAA